MYVVFLYLSLPWSMLLHLIASNNNMLIEKTARETDNKRHLKIPPHEAVTSLLSRCSLQNKYRGILGGYCHRAGVVTMHIKCLAPPYLPNPTLDQRK